MTDWPEWWREYHRRYYRRWRRLIPVWVVGLGLAIFALVAADSATWRRIDVVTVTVCVVMLWLSARETIRHRRGMR